jgi:hypothetical protein
MQFLVPQANKHAHAQLPECVCCPARWSLSLSCRVLATGGRKPLRSSNLPDPNSRPSTAASLLSLSGKQQLFGGQSPSRPGTSTSVARMGGAPAAAAAAGGRGRVESSMGGLSAVGAAFNRTLLLELVQQDDVSQGQTDTDAVMLICFIHTAAAAGFCCPAAAS